MKQQAETNKLILERLLISGATKQSKQVHDSGKEPSEPDDK